MRQNFFTNLKYLALGIILVGIVGLAHADFPMPAASAPANTIDVPVHTGPTQVKDGGLSVGTFLANQNAQFKQQTFLKGTVFGGTPGLSTSTVAIGDGIAPANIVVNGNVSAAQYIQSTSVANGNSSNLCATANGTIVTCTVGATNTPTITVLGNAVVNNGTTKVLLQIGQSVAKGNVFSIILYYHKVTVTAVAGDNAESIAQKMIAAINNTTMSQWQSIDTGAEYPGWTPPDSDPRKAPTGPGSGFPPSAVSTISNPSEIIFSFDPNHTLQGYDASPQ